MTISLCMIVKDEAGNLADCLQSAQGLADEVIVVDTGSTDQTVAIAQSFGAQVHFFDWGHDFAAARNAALSYATGDWILVLDGDETLQPEVTPVLQSIDQGKSVAGIAAKNLLLVNLMRWEVGAQQSPYTLVSRFFRNHPKLRFNRPYHETVDDSIVALQSEEPHWQIATLDAVAIHHRGYQADAIAQRHKFERARAIMEGYLANHPTDAYLCNKLAALYGQEADWEKALPLLHQGISQREEDPTIRYELHYHLGLAYRHLQQLDQAEQHYQLALQQPLLPRLKLGAQINLGSLYKHTGQISKAIAQFEQAADIDPSSAQVYFNLGVAHRVNGNLDCAIAAYQRAIEIDPAYPEAHQNLGVALFKLGKIPQCRQAFAQAIQLYEQSDPQAAIALQNGLKKLGIG
ncbi:MAG TPA: tetratricopeptide repeat protein [Leptolyngbyaceae cyanobacterium]